MAREPAWKRSPVVRVSDGGGVFDYESDTSPLRRLFRYPTLVGKQALALRKRWLITSFTRDAADPRTLDGTYWGIGSATDSYDVPHGSSQPAVPGYPRGLVEAVIARIRTDLDAFSEGEIAVLENHGYLLAAAAIQRHVPHLAAAAVPVRVPHAGWMDAERVQRALTTSHRRTLVGRM